MGLLGLNGRVAFFYKKLWDEPLLRLLYQIYSSGLCKPNSRRKGLWRYLRDIARTLKQYHRKGQFSRISAGADSWVQPQAFSSLQREI